MQYNNVIQRVKRVYSEVEFCLKTEVRGNHAVSKSRRMVKD